MSEHQTRKRQIENRKMSVKRISKYDLDYTNYVNKMNSSGYTAYSKEKYLSKRDNANREYENQLNSIKENLRSEYNNAIDALVDFKNNYNSIYKELYKFNGEWFSDTVNELITASDFYEPFNSTIRLDISTIGQIANIQSAIIKTKQGMDQEKEFLDHLLDCLNGEKAGI